VAETYKGVQDFVDESGASVDVTPAYTALWAFVDELKQKVESRFALTRDPSSEQFEDYRGDNGDGTGPFGTIRAYSGPEIDWMVHSWLANPTKSFTNIHLTIWLGPQVQVPHFGLAFGTFPFVWCYLDNVPRTDLMVDLDYLDTYYEPVNAEHLDVRQRPGLDAFVSHGLYVRQSLSETAHCFSCRDEELALATVTELAHKHLDRWLRWVDEAPVVPEDERPALRERDETIRRNIAERDPANVMGVRYFGEQMTDDLVRTLWGGGRALPRP
jgi:hypothetical protein